MRVDKYLWCIRYFKTRSLATHACKKGWVKVNGDAVKPAREVYPGDELTVRKNQVNYNLEILDIPTGRLGAKLVDLYRKDTTPSEATENTALLKYTKTYYRNKGSGRPTKKDRRDLEDFADSPED